MPDVQSAKEYSAEAFAEDSTDAQVGSPPKVVLPPEATVPENAPKHHEGPLAPGTIIKVKKKEEF